AAATSSSRSTAGGSGTSARWVTASPTSGRCSTSCGSDGDAEPAVELRTKVRARDAGRSLIDWLAERFRYESREAWCAQVRAGRVTVDGLRVAPEHLLVRGATVGYRRGTPEPPAPTELRIVHDADGLVVV